MKTNHYDLIVIGAGAAGILAAIVAARDEKRVLLLEKLPQIASKLKATGGGKCNLTNTLSNENFMSHFGRDGRFMQDALGVFDSNSLVEFFSEIGVQTDTLDGFRVFPTSHSSTTVVEALKHEMARVGIDIKCKQKVENILNENSKVIGLQTQTQNYYSSNIILATGGLGYPTLGSEGDGYTMAKNLGHKVTQLYPAMMPLHTKESWVKNCKADTLPKVEMKVDIKKYKKYHAKGDLIFTNKGIRGPVVLDFATDITPLLQKYKEVPVVLNIVKGMDEDKIIQHIKNQTKKHTHTTILDTLTTLLPHAISLELCKLSDINPTTKTKDIKGIKKVKLIKFLVSMPLTIVGHDGFGSAMITKGGITLKEIDPKTMQSKIIKGLYFCGEIVNLDGPCGGYNLQWSFSSGYLAGKLKN
jgi:predicted Rossmann fold flavoprotein